MSLSPPLEFPMMNSPSELVLQSIQQRSRDRATSFSDSTAGPTTSASPTWTPIQGDALIRDLEADLRLAAQTGIALLSDKAGLEKRLTTVESANQKLLDRLTTSVKENSQLQRRLEEAVSNLEQAESNNRSLLVALEENRKHVSRLSADTVRLSASSSHLKKLTRAHEDVLQELSHEQKRAASAENKVRKQAERVDEMEERLRRAIEDLEKMRQDKVLRSRQSHDAIAKVKARFQVAMGAGGGGAFGEGGARENPEAAELIKIVESLVSENDLLRSESIELHELLDHSRDEQVGLRSEMANREAFAEEDEDDNEGIPYDRSRRTLSLSSSIGVRPETPLASENLLSPSVSNSFFSDFDAQRSPTSTHPTSFTRSWGPSSNLSTLSSRPRVMDRSHSERSTSPAEFVEPGQAARPRRRAGHGGSGALVGSGSSGGTKVPFGRGHTRRAMSVDVNNFGRRNDELPNLSPRPPNSPPTRPPSVISSHDGDELARPRRHHRPLSLSLGPSLFPLVPEDGQPRSPVQFYGRRPSQSLAYSPSGHPSLASAPSGLSLSSPEKKKKTKPAVEIDEGAASVHLVDSFTQTSPTLLPAHTFTLTTPKPSTSVFPKTFDNRSLSPQDRMNGSDVDPSTSAASTSSFSELGIASDSTIDSRTASLGLLIEHAAKLLLRIQGADITSQEMRLKKQHLPGDVRHLAQANLRELLHDIEGLRTHFRRVLEQERTTAARGGHAESNESLVLRKDFVALVKLFRDLLFETSRLRSLVNRIELDPALATDLRELDVLNEIDATPKSAAATSAGLLAPFSKFFSAAMSSEPDTIPKPATSQNARPPIRPTVKLSGSSAVTSATVNVEFGSGATVRRAVSRQPGEEGSPDVQTKDSPRQGSIGRQKSETQVRRDLSNIFAGGLPAPKSPNAEPWVVLPSAVPAVPVPRRMPSLNPFGRLLGSYVPAMSSTTNAVLDSLPHVPPPTTNPQPTLLERQLRPRGLSDSSIRSTFVAHANPHHRLISPATLALSSETTSVPMPTAIPIISRTASDSDQPASSAQQHLSILSTSMSRKPSSNALRPKASHSGLRSVSTPLPTTSSPSKADDIPPVPPMPISISVSPSTPMSAAVRRNVSPSTGSGMGESPATPVGSLFGSLSTWATKAAAMSPLTASADMEEERGRRGGVAGTESSRPASLGDRARRHLG